MKNRFATVVALAACAIPSARVVAGPCLTPASAARGLSPLDFTFRHDGVFGTSMDLLVCAPRAADARECHARVLLEIERLRRILSTYDSTSEISRLMVGVSGIESPELAEVLDAYATWRSRTGGAIDVNMGAVRALWRSAAKSGQVPTYVELRAAFATPRAYNVDALGKGYIIDRAVEVARRFSPAGLLDIGGDLRAWGEEAFTIGIADPANPADNAPPVATFALRDAACATSGSYARPIEIGGERYSHVIDPRTHRPAPFDVAATVVAADCVSANALSTAACVLGASEGATLAEQYGRSWMVNAGRVLVGGGNREATAGGHLSGGGFEVVARRLVTLAAATAPWPADFQVSFDLVLKVARGGKVKRPYVAIWIEDSKGKNVRTITVWGTQQKYLREMTAWWQAIGGDAKVIRSVTRATREAGKYNITWDGADDAGNPMPRGDYTLVVEVNREHGRHVGERVKLALGDKALTATLKATAESDESVVTYGPKAKTP